MRDTADDALALPDLSAIRAAHERIAPHVHRTPVLTCRALDEEVGGALHFKCENFQKIGAFKARGATNAADQPGTWVGQPYRIWMRPPVMAVRISSQVGPYRITERMSVE